MAKQPSRTPLVSWRPLLFIGVLLLVCVLLVPQISQLREGFSKVADANMAFLVIAATSVAGAVVASGGTYTFLACKRVKFSELALVQAAGMFVNRLLPAGVGGMGLNARYLYVRKHTIAQAATIAGMNNLLTGFGHFLLLIIAVGLFDIAFPEVQVPSLSFGILAVSAAFFIGIIIVLGQRFAWIKSVQRFGNDMVTALNQYKKRRIQLIISLGFAMTNTLCHTLALYFCMLAFDVHMSVAIALLVLTGGVAAASVTPTPGGVVGAEAGLAAGMIGFGVEAPIAVAIAVSYRIVSYWLPLLPGALALFYIQQRKLI